MRKKMFIINILVIVLVVKSSIGGSGLVKDGLSKELGNTVLIGNTKIQRFKGANLLTKEEKVIYIKMLRKGGLKRGIDDKSEVIRVNSGGDLMRVISYEHLLGVIKQIKASKIDYGFDSNDAFDEIKIPLIFVERPLEGRKGTKGENDKKSRRFSVLGGNDIRYKYSYEMAKRLILGRKDVKGQVVESFLGGLLNKDPRVRLFSIHVLRRLIPVASERVWEFVNKRVAEHEVYGRIKGTELKLDTSYETVRGSNYKYNELNLKEVDASDRIVYNELLSLRRYISREILVSKIRGGESGVIGIMRGDLYKRLLAGQIDGEAYYRIPINYFRSKNEVKGLLAGFTNKDEEVGESCANALIRILRTGGIDIEQKTYIVEGMVYSKGHKYIISGFPEEERNNLTREDIKRLTKLYLSKVELINNCPPDYADRYDSKSNPSGCIEPKSFKGVVVTRDEFWGYEPKQDEKLKPYLKRLERDYILE